MIRLLCVDVDLREEARRNFAKKYQCPVFAVFHEALANVKADAASVAAPDAFHAPCSIASMRAGLDVICEKPIAATLDDARHMCGVAQKTGLMLMIRHQLRWLPLYNKARELVSRGEIGKLQSLELDMSVFSNVCRGGYRSKLPHLMPKDLGIHHLDLIRYLKGADGEML